MSPYCARCKRPCCPGRTPGGLVPLGHVRYHGSGICHTCYTVERRKRGPEPSRQAACIECGVVRNVKKNRANSTGLCRTCYIGTARGKTLEPVEFDESEVELTGGRWVFDARRRILVWREDVAA